MRLRSRDEWRWRWIAVADTRVLVIDDLVAAPVAPVVPNPANNHGSNGKEAANSYANDGCRRNPIILCVR